MALDRSRGDQVLFHPQPDDASLLATQNAKPYVDTEPVLASPVAVLPEPTEVTVIGSLPWYPENGAPPMGWSGATTAWLDGSTPTDGYLAWAQLYVLTKPGNGATYFDIYAKNVVTTSTNPTIETYSLMGGTYEKIWTDPQPDGALYVTNIINPAYTDTNANDPYPGLTSVVYFTTKSGQTGHFDMSTETWTFDPVRGIVDTPTATSLISVIEESPSIGPGSSSL